MKKERGGSLSDSFLPLAYWCLEVGVTTSTSELLFFFANVLVLNVLFTILKHFYGVQRALVMLKQEGPTEMGSLESRGCHGLLWLSVSHTGDVTEVSATVSPREEFLPAPLKFHPLLQCKHPEFNVLTILFTLCAQF